MNDGTFTEISHDKNSDKLEAKVVVEAGSGLVKGNNVTLSVDELSMEIMSIKSKDGGEAELELRGVGPGTVKVTAE
jgi:hypothetical protein